MLVNNSLILSILVIILFSTSAILLIQEPDKKRKSKPYFVAYFLLVFVAMVMLDRIPRFQYVIEPLILEMSIILASTSLTLGNMIRFEKKRLEYICYVAFVVQLFLIFFVPYNLIPTSAYIIINIAIILLAIFTRFPKPNIADKMLAISLSMWGVVMVMNIFEIISTDQYTRAYYFHELMVGNLIFAPAYLSGVSIFILSSFMFDSNSELSFHATRDSLTGLLNRRALFQEVDSQKDRLNRNNQKACVIIADIDFFKKINDNYGHEAGDIAIKLFSNVIESSVREVDVSSRYGGEEFLIFLPNCNMSDAITAAERVRKNCEQSSFEYNTETITFTASFGISEHDINVSIDATIAKADENLYQAKSLGRNQVYPSS
ncbi:GGDEF domain-containing protein [Vibrio sp. S4M6]|uniref:GGDEF domain-containing protein n=1 Tax=Vibrio sinus TaxID=2946865 RepID=UPI00202A3CDE|nr:GGDEF domain-containing protein [Vibrio sinus]MCL9780140.1 GGDEF domain-containing protein [Vibrio sinus]